MRRGLPCSFAWFFGAICLWAVLPGMAAHAETLRFGVHPGFDRLVAVLADGEAYSATQEAGRVTIHADALGVVVASEPGGRRIRAIAGGQDMLSFSADPRARRRIWRSGDRLVIDVFDQGARQADPGPKSAPTPAPTFAPTFAPARIPARSAPRPGAAVPSRVAKPIATVASAGVMPMPVPSPGPSVALPVPPGLAPAPVGTLPGPPPQPIPAGSVQQGPVRQGPLQQGPVQEGPVQQGPVQQGSVQQSPREQPLLQQAPHPSGASIQLEAADETFPLGSLLIAAPAEVGAAAFARNGAAHVVFDAALPLDLSVLKDDPAYGATTAEPLPAAAHLILRPPDGMRLLLSRQSDGWRLGFSREDGKQVPILVSPRAGGLAFDAPSSGTALVIDDRQTGATLLVGTQRTGMGRVAAGRRTPEFIVPATWLGVVVDTASDRIGLRAGAHGFMLRTLSGPEMATSWPGAAQAAVSDTASLTRRFDFPDLSVPMLRNRLHDAMRDEAQAPALARHEARLKTAQAMLALGLDVEASAILQAAASDDPRSDAQDGAALGSIAAGLAGRPGYQPASRAAASAATDEDGFWQALLRPPGPDAAQHAATLAATWKLALSYPEPLRHAVLPRVAELLLRGGQTEALDGLLHASQATNLDLARAELARVRGHSDEALAGLDRVGLGTDRDQSARARREAVELRLAERRITSKDAVKALQSQVFAWRGDDRELDLRLEVAALLEQSGAWRAALEALRDAELLYPEAHDRLHQAQADLVGDLLRQDGASAMPPLELVALVGECADLLGQTKAGAVLAPVLVDKLLALDLPERAEPILRRMIQSATSAGPKAELGLRLAELLLAKGDASGASTALETTASPELAPGLATELAARRSLFKAKLLASIGDKEGALRLLAMSDRPEALDQRAALLEQLHDWEGAMAVLSTAIHQRIPGSGPLNGAQADLVLRYASDAAQAGDMAALRQIHDDDGGRIAAGGQADLLRVLTQSPVRAVDDIPRASEELATARALPANFAASQLR